MLGWLQFAAGQQLVDIAITSGRNQPRHGAATLRHLNRSTLLHQVDTAAGVLSQFAQPDPLWHHHGQHGAPECYLRPRRSGRSHSGQGRTGTHSAVSGPQFHRLGRGAGGGGGGEGGRSQAGHGEASGGEGGRPARSTGSMSAHGVSGEGRPRRVTTAREDSRRCENRSLGHLGRGSAGPPVPRLSRGWSARVPGVRPAPAGTSRARSRSRSARRCRAGPATDRAAGRGTRPRRRARTGRACRW